MELKHEQLVYEKEAGCFFHVIGNITRENYKSFYATQKKFFIKRGCRKDLYYAEAEKNME